MGLSSVTTRIALWDQVWFELRKNVSQKDVKTMCAPNETWAIPRTLPPQRLTDDAESVEDVGAEN